MLRLRRKLLLETLLIGVAITSLVILADVAGLLNPLENWSYDQRVLHCQPPTQTPTTQLVHLDIDDRSLEVIGAWPWPRGKLAAMLDELARAQPRAVALDIIFSEPQDISHESQSDGTYLAVDHDALLAAAIQRLGCVIVPAVLFSDQPAASPLATAILAELKKNLELTEAQLLDRLHRQGWNVPGFESQVASLFFPLRRAAVFDRLSEHALPTPSSTVPIDHASPLANIIRQQTERVASIDAISRLALSILPASAGGAVATANGAFLAPLPPFIQAAKGAGFVDFFSDGTVRTVPLLARHGDRFYPQLGLALALRMLDVGPKDVEFNADSITLHRPGSPDIVIPVHTGTTGLKERGLPLLLDIPWFGSRDWETMYDSPNHAHSKQHVPILKLWQVGELKRKIRANCRDADAALLIALVFTNQNRAKEYEAHRPAADDVAARIAFIDKTLAEKDVKGWAAQLAALPIAQQDADSRKFLIAYQQLTAVLPQLSQLRQDLKDQRAELARDFGGKAVLFGWTATGAAADLVPTPLHDRCPGVVVHGAVFNAVMTGHFWRRPPGWILYLITFSCGLFTAAIAAGFSALRGLLCTLLLLCAYLLVNGLLLFGHFNLLIGVAAPVLTIGIVWAGCLLFRIIVETREREHIKDRFRAYVDPVLVNFVLEHPERASLEGQVKELTVVFTDLANFTALSETLGEKSVSLLNDYLGRMVPIIRKYRGYVNKFLGDGIMCFYGAPADSPTHAADAVRTALDMQSAMATFNETLAVQGLGPLMVRAGISTGKMVVGDAGAIDASDYTVLGDAVNLGARLEGANKFFGTRVLVTARTAGQSAAHFLFRPLGRLLVVGKTEGVDVFEAICPLDRATEEQKHSVELTRAMVAAYQAGQFEACLQTIAEINRQPLDSKLMAIYRERCEKYLREPPSGPWDGTIALTEK